MLDFGFGFSSFSCVLDILGSTLGIFFDLFGFASDFLSGVLGSTLGVFFDLFGLFSNFTDFLLGFVFDFDGSILCVLSSRGDSFFGILGSS